MLLSLIASEILLIIIVPAPSPGVSPSFSLSKGFDLEWDNPPILEKATFPVTPMFPKAPVTIANLETLLCNNLIASSIAIKLPEQAPSTTKESWLIPRKSVISVTRLLGNIPSIFLSSKSNSSYSLLPNLSVIFSRLPLWTKELFSTSFK